MNSIGFHRFFSIRLNDTEIDAIKATGASRTQQYKMAGNSICVNALSAVFDKLFVHTADKEKRLF